MSVPSEHLLGLAAILFGIGVLGFLIRRNTIIVLASLELVLNAANLSFLAGARMHAADGLDQATVLTGPVFAMFVILIAACEAAVGLALVIALYRRKRTVVLDAIREMSG